MMAMRRIARCRRPQAALWILAGCLVSQTGCGGTGGAWLWWLTDPEQEVKAEYELGKGRLLVLIDGDRGWLPDPSIRPLLTQALIQELGKNDVNKHVISYGEVARLQKREKDFATRGGREIGEKLKADLVLHIKVLDFDLRHETVEPAYQGLFVATVKVLDVHAEAAEDVRLWPRSADGKRVQVDTDLHTEEGKGYDEKLTRRLCQEIGDKIAKLFYDHKAPKPL